MMADFKARCRLEVGGMDVHTLRITRMWRLA